MKKIKMIFLCLLAVVLVTGCGAENKQKKLVCRSTEEEEGMSIEEVISMTYKNNKLNHMTMEVNTTITDSDVKDNWEAYKEFMNEDNEEFSKEGISLKVNVDDDNYKYNTILDIDIEKASEEDLEEQGFEGLKDDDSTIEDSKKTAEEDGATCTIE